MAITFYCAPGGIRGTRAPLEPALANSAMLVTHNTDEFSRVRGLRLVDWY
jgi:hypothetical protein